MKVALVGYGKMGKAIEEILLERGHEIVARLTKKPDYSEVKDADVAIEFSHPEAAFENIKVLMENRIPTISGTTGWLDKLAEIKQLNAEKQNAFLYASNFSLGVNLFFELNTHLAKLMANYPEYTVEIEEIHHTQKLDKPSGTGITLAEQIIENSTYSHWESDQKSTENTLPILSKRLENVPGTHTVNYHSEVDDISITHTAHSRKGFALGAVLAAEWIQGKSGFFSMKDVLSVTI
ncbi:MAG: 4-hydroxy-tetrahydrodipicolinate reductase [Weeksellaceae bacterium]|jgi:4-hydroxy-tetrahydrodipicolinate reductase|nr:4-hydroxy-tetrahydrodipicolinate reductase [Weeksellaceae bacterium]MDX9705294.1 4-hydroxy-tetrahydrodipicolinate reductase [Weeksellaceae bacterium]